MTESVTVVDVDFDALRERARAIRARDLQMVYDADLGHIGGEFSAIDILVTLYSCVLRIDPKHPDAPDRDRFVLSKGHSAAALYATLAYAGFFDPTELATFMAPMSRLNGHPDRNKVPGVETNTGPLGHGLPVAVGMALAARWTARHAASSCSPATVNCRRAACGRPRWRRGTSAWRT